MWKYIAVKDNIKIEKNLVYYLRLTGEDINNIRRGLITLLSEIPDGEPLDPIVELYKRLANPKKEDWYDRLGGNREY